MPPTDGDASSAYRSKIRSLFQNLKQKSNAGLRSQLLSGTIKPEKFVTMSDEELQSSELQQEIARIEKENMHEAMVPQEEKSITAAFTCSKCKNNKVSYTQAQTRSAVCSQFSCHHARQDRTSSSARFVVSCILCIY